MGRGQPGCVSLQEAESLCVLEDQCAELLGEFSGFDVLPSLCLNMCQFLCKWKGGCCLFFFFSP